MKKLSFYIGILLFAITGTNAQVSADIHFGPPRWAPPSAPATVEYYYLPDLGVYYDVPAQRYIYMRNGAWIRAAALPPRYRGYDLYHSRPVYLTNYRGRTPYAYYKEHRVKYKGNGWKRKDHDNGKHRGHRGKK